MELFIIIALIGWIISANRKRVAEQDESPARTMRHGSAGAGRPAPPEEAGSPLRPAMPGLWESAEGRTREPAPATRKSYMHVVPPPSPTNAAEDPMALEQAENAPVNLAGIALDLDADSLMRGVILAEILGRRQPVRKAGEARR
ncbi:MAG: hypothetical protein FWF69_09840 [Firmicutes bacterium]|nr:hypothetical protein [Bacillota bacterium]